MEATDIYGYLRTYANELGSRILELTRRRKAQHD
jgi:hypothetical protein